MISASNTLARSRTHALVVVVIHKRLVNLRRCPCLILQLHVEKPNELLGFPLGIEQAVREVGALKHTREGQEDERVDVRR